MRVIAYYLPQFHEIPENNEWWGEGFTEWTNVKKAVPLFKGHYQPKIPGELGYYDLNNTTIREAQAKMAKDSGIEAFCYWHYWFGNGQKLLEMPFKEVLNTKSPDFKFCLGWANESWKAKVWSNQDGSEDKILIEQFYPGEKDIIDHFNHILSAFKDERYLKIDDKPVFVIYRPFQLNGQSYFIETWNKLAKENGLKGIHFVGHTLYSKEIEDILNLGFDAVNVFPLGDCKRSKIQIILHLKSLILFSLKLKPLVYQYKNAINSFNIKENYKENVYPSIIPNWDHTSRSKKYGFVLDNSNPKLFKRHVECIFDSIVDKPKEKQLVFLKSWNEWGEGNYIEPDLKFGNQYLQTIKRIINKYK